MRRNARIVLPLLLAAAVARGQDTLWVANRASSDLTQVSLCGKVLATVPVGSNLRRVKQAPDGKLWVIKFIQPTFALMNSDGTNPQNIAYAFGSPYDVEFDKAGHAWMSGGSGVVEYDAAGVQVATYPTTTNALGITVDVDDNKWIAHRNGPPGSITKIAAVTGAITNFPAPTGSNILHTGVIADFRGLGVSSHIWAVGDTGNRLDEWDSAGTPIGSYLVGSSLSSLATNASGQIWAGSFGASGFVYRFDPATTTVVQSFSVPPACLGLAFDGFGRLWATARFSTTLPAEVRRLDLATGSVEVPTVVGSGTQSALSTRYQFALVTDPTADSDGDGEINIAEILTGTSPWDPQSTSLSSMLISGPTAINATATVSLATSGPNLTLLAASPATISPGLAFPGVTGVLWLDPTQLLIDPFTGGPLILSVIGPFTAPLGMPPIAGFDLSIQGVTFGPTSTQFSNVTCFHTY